MDTKFKGVPDPGAGKRRQIDRTSLAAAMAEQEQRDARQPPASLLTTMGAIRLLGDLILDRKHLGWTDPRLIVLLRELGVEISAETLRVYRGRLKKERSDDTAPAPATVRAAAVEEAPAATSVGASNHIRSDRAAPPPAAAQGPSAQPTPNDKDDKDQPRFDRSTPFDDGV